LNAPLNNGHLSSARYVFNKHPELFEKNRIEMEPPIKSFMPKTRFTKATANEELINVYLEGDDLDTACKVYEAMEEKGTEVFTDNGHDLLKARFHVTSFLSSLRRKLLSMMQVTH
jgi:pentatricopeptide repeat protein